MKRISRASIALLASGMAFRTEAVEGNTGAAAAPEVQKVGAAPRKPIINGRMPVAIVALARFGNTKGEATKIQADLFGTTVGKIDDIRKNRNFAYVTADFKPTAEMKAAGLAWLKTHPDYDKQGVDKLVQELDATPEATADEAAAFEAVRVKARGQLATTKEGEVADAGGGNRRTPRNKASKDKPAGAPADAQATGDALLA